MKKKLSDYLKQEREKRNIPASVWAKKLKITKGYLAHLECGTPVYLSLRLVTRLYSVGLRNSILLKLASEQNIRARAYQNHYRKRA